jgi:putative ABC transport system permease protein
MIGNALVLALREIRRNLLRAILTTLGIVIGVAAVIAIVTLGNGAQESISGTISSLGRNLIILQPGVRRGGPGPGGGGGGANVAAQPFTMEDVAAIEHEIANIRAVAPLVTRAAVVVSGNQNHPTQVAGSQNAYMGVRDWPLASGRIFTAAEERAGRAVCILGETVRKSLFGVQDPVGAEIRVGQVPCRVIGLLVPKGNSTFGQDQDELVMMPLRTVQRRLVGRPDVNNILVSVVREEDIPATRDRIVELMRERRQIRDGAEDDFRANDMLEIASVMQTTTGILTAFLAAIAAISLLVGGIGIMNVMLMSVTERTREIGIRLAIGARERDVLIQFLVEAMVMAGLGGIGGILLGLGGAAVATHFLELPFRLSLPMTFIAVLFSGLIGIGFGFFPARRAARLNPIEALRHE